MDGGKVIIRYKLPPQNLQDTESKKPAVAIMTQFESWFTGLCDGEASFTYQPNIKSLIVRPRFNICQVAGDETVLERIRNHFGFVVKVEGTYLEGNNERGCPRNQLSVSKRSDLNRLLEHFAEWPLQTKRANAYGVWKQMVLEYSNRAGYSKVRLANLAIELVAISGRDKGRTKDGQAKLAVIQRRLSEISETSI